MIQNAPECVAVERVAFILNVSVFHWESIINPERNVCDCQERNELASRFLLSELYRVRAAAKCVDDPRSLNHDLKELSDNDCNIEIRSVDDCRKHAEDCFREKRRNCNEQKNWVKKTFKEFKFYNLKIFELTIVKFTVGGRKFLLFSCQSQPQVLNRLTSLDDD